jgi:CYTH domain-containing protein
MVKLEMEKRWLLKRLPNVKWNSVIDIHQFYLREKESGTNFRLRLSMDRGTGKATWVRNEKVEIRPNVSRETEKKVKPQQALKLIQENTVEKELKKARYIYKKGNHKHEVDIINRVALVLLEIEFKSEEIFNKQHKLLECFEELAICEVTGAKSFSNYNLAENSITEKHKHTHNFTNWSAFR